MKIGLLKGDGIGPEITEAVQKIFGKMKLGIEWVELPCGEGAIRTHGSALPEITLKTLRELKVALKGPTSTPIGKGHRSANVSLRKELDLYANLRPVESIPGVRTRFENVNLTIVRENTEDVYIGNERQVDSNTAECIKTITRQGSMRIADFAFKVAQRYERKKVTCVQKANIMKLTDGLFLECFREVARKYPQIESQELLVDNTCMQLVTRPEQFDVIVTENLYGDILSDLCAGLVGGLGVTGGANIGNDCAVFEAVHGTAPDIAGKNLANPTAMILSSIMMLEHLQKQAEASFLKRALYKTLGEGRSVTRDLKGSASTSEFTDALISKFDDVQGACTVNIR